MMNKRNKHSLHRRDILNGIQKTKIKAYNLSVGKIIIIISFLIIAVSLLNPWFSLNYNDASYGAFSKITGLVGYLSVVIIVVNMFTIFSLNLKHKIKTFLYNSIEDSSLFLFSSLLLFILGINSIISLGGLQLFSSEVKFHSGIIFYILGTILFLFGSILNKKTIKASQDTFFTNHSSQTDHPNTKKEKKHYKVAILNLTFVKVTIY